MNAKLEMSEEEADRRVVEQKEKKVAALTEGLEDERKAVAKLKKRQRQIARSLIKRHKKMWQNS